MRRTLLAAYLLLLVHGAVAQKQGNVWILFNNVALDFNTTPPRTYRPFPVNQRVPVARITSSLCDSAGRLLSWSNGPEIFGPYGLMLNGSGVGTGAGGNPSLLIPMPGSDSLIYVFNCSSTLTPASSPGSYSYSVVNTCLDRRRPDSIRGNVIAGQKTVRMMDTNTTTMLCAASDGASGYWVLGHRSGADSFIAWHLTASGISGRGATAIGPRFTPRTGIGARCMKFNADGTKVAMQTTAGAGVMATLDLFDFNPATGRLSNHCQNYLDSNIACLGLDFSPDGSKIYSCYWDGRNSYLLQNKVVSTCSSVGLSRDTVLRLQNVLSQGPAMWDVQAGPDGYVYVGVGASYASRSRLFRITNPNYIPRIDSTTIVLDTGAIGQYLPSFVAGFRYHNRVPKCAVPVAVMATSTEPVLRLTPNPAHDAVQIVTSGIDRASLRLTLTDAAGKAVFHASPLPQGIDVRDLPAGLYFWRITGETRMSATGKLVIRHD